MALVFPLEIKAKSGPPWPVTKSLYAELLQPHGVQRGVQLGVIRQSRIRTGLHSI